MKNKGGNLIALVWAQLAIMASGFILQVVLARYFGKESYGLYAFIMTAATLPAWIYQFNIPNLLSREVAQGSKEPKAAMAEGLSATLLLSVAGMGCTVLLITLLDPRPQVLLCAVLAAVWMSLFSLRKVPEGILQGLQRMQVIAPATAVGRLVLLFVALALLWVGLQVEGVFIAMMVSQLVLFLLLMIYVHRQIGGLKLETDLKVLRALVLRAWPFALNILFSMIYIASDLLIVKWFHGDGEAGIYRVASVFVGEIAILGAMLNRALYPRYSKHFERPHEAAADLNFATRIQLAISVPIAIGGLCVAEPLLVFMVGQEYIAGVTAMSLCLLVLPFRFVKDTYGNGLTALNFQTLRTRAVFYAAMFNLVANLIVVPRFGATGAAATTVATEMLLTLYIFFHLQRIVGGLRWVGFLLRVLVPTVVMSGVVLLLFSWPVMARIGVGILVFLPIALWLGVLKRDDLSALRSI